MIAVTARRIAGEDFLKKLERVASAHPRAVILREKDLGETEYAALYGQCALICEKYGVPLAVNGFRAVAERLGAEMIQLSYRDFALGGYKMRNILKGVSVHSAEEAKAAEMLGADSLIAGHIYRTDCKKGLAGRGIGFLKEVVRSVSIPVYAIGGIETSERIKEVTAAGAADYCVMSSLWK